MPPRTKKTTPAPTPEVTPGDALPTSIKDWFEGLGSNGDVRCKVTRLSPAIDDDGQEIKGYLGETGPENLDEAYLKRRWGGGKYQLRLVDGDTGKYMRARNVEIAGPPKGKMPVVTAAPLAPATAGIGLESERLSAKAMDVAANVAAQERDARERAEQRAWDAANNQKPDPMVAVLQSQLAEQRAAAQRLQDRADERPQHESRLLEMIAGGKVSEINGIRENHAGELRSLRENHTAEVRMLHERHDRQIESVREDTKRQLSGQQMIYEGRIQSLDSSYQSQLSLLNVQLEHERGSAKTVRSDLERLRTEKNKSPIEMLQEFGALKEGLSVLTENNEPEAETWEKVMDKVQSSPLIQGISSRLGTAVAAPAPVMLENPAQLEPPPPAEGEMSPGEAVQAIEFLEHAIEARSTTPEKFAGAARSNFPKQLLDEIVNKGADFFVDQVASMKPDSVICSMHGRQFVREVVTHLSGGDASPVATE